MSRFSDFKGYLKPFWKKEIAILVLNGIVMALGLINPYIAKLIIDEAYGNKDLKLFTILICLSAVIFFINGIFTGLSNYLNNYVKLRVDFVLRCKVFRKLQHLSYSFFQNSSTGEHLYKISYDIENLARFIADLLPKFIVLISKSIFIFLILLYINQKIALFALALAPFLYIGPYYFSRKLRKALKTWMEDSQAIFKGLQEVLSHIQLVKALNKEKRETAGYIKDIVQNIRLKLKNSKLEISCSFINNLANRLILGLIISYGGYQVIKGKMTLGSLSAITIYLSQLSNLQNSLAYFFQQISAGIVSYERLNMIFDAESGYKENDLAREIIFSKCEIEVKNLSFEYKTDKVVLKNLNFLIPDGSFIALVGHSGSGKTTIINLLLRLYEQSRGDIFIQNYNIKSIKLSSLREQIGVALQDPHLWNDTIGNNIRYAREEATDEEMFEAAEISGVDEFVRNLSAGYGTIIGENACKLSEGQKQKIAIARALIKKPKILILDEAMSSIDSQGEEKIIARIRKLSYIHTVIIVSHRLSSVMDCDYAYFLKSPDKMLIGKPQQLLYKDEAFYNLFAAQIKEFP